MLTLILSDVIGDRLEDVASGPSAADGTSFADAVAVIEKYELRDRIPGRAMAYLLRGMAGAEPETLKTGDAGLMRTRNVVIGSVRQALEAAREKAVQLGFAAEILTTELQGEARDAARRLAHAARQARDAARYGRCCLLSGGETTVSVRGTGKGGRNQELALAFALEIEGLEDVTLLSAGTDGSDGPTDAAGAIVSGKTASLARRLSIEPLSYLENNDSYGFFARFDAMSGEGSHFITGPTGTNVMDVQIMLLGRAD
jgi:glycerate-2-kinase